VVENGNNMTDSKLLTEDDKRFIRERELRENPYCHKGVKLFLIVKHLIRIKRINDCWVWGGGKNPDGYGELRFQGKTVYAHRFFYELFNNKIPRNLTIDHLCNVRDCVNPKHMETIPLGENVARGFTRKYWKEQNGSD